MASKYEDVLLESMQRNLEYAYDNQKIHSLLKNNKLLGVYTTINTLIYAKRVNNILIDKTKFCAQLSLNDVYNNLNPKLKMRYAYQNKLNKSKLQYDLQRLSICHLVRRINSQDVVQSFNYLIFKEKQMYYNNKLSNNVFASAPYYELIDIKDNHLDRLKIINKMTKNLTYTIVKERFNEEIAQNCFSNLFRNNHYGLLAFGGSMETIVDIIKSNEVISLKDLAEQCSNFEVTNDDKQEVDTIKSQKWWYKQLRGFDFSQYNIVLCKNNKLGKRKQLPIYGGTLVFYYNKKKEAKIC